MPYPKRFTSERFIYKPNSRKKVGEHCYEGPPCATKEIYERIGQQGIDKIHSIMQTMLETRKQMFGDDSPEYYGFHDKEIFYDLKTQTTIKILADPVDYLDGSSDVELHSEELLQNANAYLLTLFPSFDKDIGKIAFKNQVRETLDGCNANYMSHREKIENIEDSLIWLKKFKPKSLLDALNAIGS